MRGVIITAQRNSRERGHYCSCPTPLPSDTQKNICYWCGHEIARVKTLGSFDWAQFASTKLNVSPDGEEIASFDKPSGYWITRDGEAWAEIIITPTELHANRKELKKQ